ncbi:hypothetical protein F5Y16DRAFT_403157 [Xylariaceae sp. FL0255]|nr:hypothetical protein F5Y16DRAFT_403157 [Xylariaceae sp. FL0255]
MAGLRSDPGVAPSEARRPEDDPLRLFLSHREQTALRWNDPNDPNLRRNTIQRVADLYAFQTAPRPADPHRLYDMAWFTHGRFQTWNDDAEGWAPLHPDIKVEKANDLCKWFPPAEEMDFVKGEEILRAIADKNPDEVSSNRHVMTSQEAKEVITTAEANFAKGNNHELVKKLIDKFPVTARKCIKKIVAIGLMNFAERAEGETKFELDGDILRRHLALPVLAKRLEELNGHDIPIYVADFFYSEEEILALAQLGITVLDSRFSIQRHFQEVDNDTYLIAIGDPRSVMPTICHYCRPVILHINEYRRNKKGEKSKEDWPEVYPVWDLVTYKGETYKVPGSSIRHNRVITEPLKRMFEDYETVHSCGEDDSKGLTNVRELHERVLKDSQRPIWNRNTAVVLARKEVSSDSMVGAPKNRSEG